MKVLISVSDKTGIVDFANGLVSKGYEILSTGGTYRVLSEAGINVKKVSEHTGANEILGGRVKTLHPVIHGGILADSRNEEHMKEIEREGIDKIDMVVCNLYPFKKTIEGGASIDDATENIDIGGPTMVRAAAKNFHSTAVIVDPADYDAVLAELEEMDAVSLSMRKRLAVKAFSHTANYDSAVASYLEKELGYDETPNHYTLSFDNVKKLRYGENPHQDAIYAGTENILHSDVLWGKELSFNNINDTSGAIELLLEFDEPTAVCVKHSNPSGVASDDNIYDAYISAHACDPVSIFGGIVALNRQVDERLAEKLNETFLEIVVAPSFTEEGLAVLMKKKNLRILKLRADEVKKGEKDFKKVLGGIIVQDKDDSLYNDLTCVTGVKPDDEMLSDLKFALKVVKHQKSNAVCLVKGKKTIGLGTGQVSRIFSMRNARDFSLSETEGSVLASEAFFPFRDSIDVASEVGVKAIIQPGGSIRDEEVIEACDEHGISMVLTGMRHFKH